MGTVVVALDSFKGSLDAATATAALARGLDRHASRPDVRLCPIADGGEGTLDVVVTAGFERVPRTVTGPLGDLVRSAYARRAGTAVVEMADACGLGRLPGSPTARTAVCASSRGLGELVAAALDDNCNTVVVALGGSCSTDGGAGMLAALGARLVDSADRPLPARPDSWTGLASVDTARLHPRLCGPDAATLVVACDVDNPLLGPDGAAAVYGPQKGAGREQVAMLDGALTRWGDALECAVGHEIRHLPGAGAAGGVGFALLAMGATMRPGIDLVVELIGLGDRLAGAELVVTGEGRLDEQTLHGKGPAGIAAIARALGVPVVAACGHTTLDRDRLRAAGFSAAYALTDAEPDVARCVQDAARLLEELGERIAGSALRPQPIAG